MHIIRLFILLTFLLLNMGIGHSQENSILDDYEYRVDCVPGCIPKESTKPEQWRHVYLKTNGIGWMMGITNVAAEIDLGKKWTLTLPVYWSGWNYFKSTLKFRTFTVQPEIRFWMMSDTNDGAFVGFHLGLGWYNFALNGNKRIQDHGGHSPSAGGGISGGYRFPISHNKRLRLEFSLGIGVYRAHYDKFHNYKNGLMTETHQNTWFGIDQAAASIVYTFDLGKKGGKR